MTKDEVLTMALELLAVATYHSPDLQAKRTEVIDAGLKALAQPTPPSECQTEAEKIAFAHGWWKALETKAQPQQEPQRPCRSPYCECSVGHCSHPGCYDARGEPWPFATTQQGASLTMQDIVCPNCGDMARTWPKKERKPLTDVLHEYARLTADAYTDEKNGDVMYSFYGGDLESLCDLIQAHGIKENT